MRDFVYQTGDHECGFACLKMFLTRLYRDERFLFLPTVKSNKENYSLFEIQEIGKKYGLHLGGYLHRNESEILNEKVPFILIMKLDNGSRHAVLIKKINKIFAYVYDPALGKKFLLTKKLLNKIKSGMEVLVMENFHPVPIDFEIPKLVNKKEQVLLVVAEAVSILCYFLSAIFINPDSNIIYPIAIIVAGIIMAIIYRIYTYTVMKKFDETFIAFTYNENPSIRHDNYHLMHMTKSGIFSSLNNLVINLISALAVNTILILKNNYSLYILIISLVLVIVDYVYIRPFIKKNAYEVEQLETGLLDRTNLDENEYINTYQNIKEKTYKVARYFDLKRIGGYFLLLMMTFLMSGIMNQANIEFILYNFAMCLFTYTCFEQVAKTIDNWRENLINQTKFYDLIIKSKK